MIPDKRVQMARELRKLRAKLTQTEHVSKAERLARQFADYDHLVARNKNERKSMKDEEKAVEHAIRETAADVHLGSEVRDVACRWVADFERKRVELIRLDTGEVVEGRNMTDSDRQLAIETKVSADDLDDIPIDPVNPPVPEADADTDADTDTPKRGTRRSSPPTVGDLDDDGRLPPEA